MPFQPKHPWRYKAVHTARGRSGWRRNRLGAEHYAVAYWRLVRRRAGDAASDGRHSEVQSYRFNDGGGGHEPVDSSRNRSPRDRGLSQDRTAAPHAAPLMSVAEGHDDAGLLLVYFDMR